MLENHYCLGEPKNAGKRSVLWNQPTQRLTNFAYFLLGSGMGEEQLLESLMHANRERCSPPLLDSEVLRIASSVAGYEPKEKSTDVE